MRLFFLTSYLVIALVGQAQLKSPNAVSMSFVNESFGYPSQHIFDASWHPGVSVEAAFDRTKETKHSEAWTAEIGFFHHDPFQTGVFLMGGWMRTHFRENRVNLSWGPKLGYLHTFYLDGIYTFENGVYRKKKGGRANLILGISGKISVQPLTKLPVRLFTGASVTADGPFAINFGIPVIPRTFWQLGMTLNLRSL